MKTSKTILKGTITHVRDGDTFEVNDTPIHELQTNLVTVRLIKILRERLCLQGQGRRPHPLSAIYRFGGTF